MADAASSALHSNCSRAVVTGPVLPPIRPLTRFIETRQAICLSSAQFCFTTTTFNFSFTLSTHEKTPLSRSRCNSPSWKATQMLGDVYSVLS